MSLIKNTIIKLSEQIKLHNYLYYTLDSPEISDDAYDILMRRLRSLENKYPEYKRPDSPTVVIGATTIKSGFKKLKRDIPLLSLDNVFSYDALINKLSSVIDVNETIVSIEHKLDGLSLEVAYNNGVLSSASTRGDGYIGEDVTANALMISNIPKTIKEQGTVKVRGEVMMSHDVFAVLNKERVADGKQPFANTRNAAAGSLKQLDPLITKNRNLFFFAYALSDDTLISEIHSQKAALSFIKNQGFSVDEHTKFTTLSKVSDVIDTVLDRRDKLSYDIDGIVIKVNDFKLQKEIGFTSKFPKWAFAYKFAAEQAVTKLNAVTWQVGRTGIVTPVAELSAIVVGGARVQRATLHNIHEIRRKNISIGGDALIQRAGDVIPEVVEMLSDGPTIIEPPEFCPVCASKLKVEETFIRCINELCPAQLVEKLTHFVSRDAMNIDGLSKGIIETLVQNKLVYSYADLFDLQYSDLIDLDRFGERKATKLLSALARAKETATVNGFVYGLGIRQIGTVLAKNLADTFLSAEQIFFNTSDEDLLSIDTFGEETLKYFRQYVQRNENLIRELLENITFIVDLEDKAQTLKDMTFLFTGKLSMPRRDAEKIAKDHGGRILSSVSKKLQFLVAGEKAGSKLKKAQSIENCRIIDEDNFLKMVKVNG